MGKQYIVQIERNSDKEIQTYQIDTDDQTTAVKQAMNTFFLNNPNDKAKLIVANPLIV